MMAAGGKPTDASGGLGRRVALFVAGTGLFWVGATYLGSELGLPNRVRALFDLMALAGFGWGLWMTLQIWRARRNDKG
jgi:threonine/homoserine/homoserine lactone efflux protein